jgi:hypothetical protein
MFQSFLAIILSVSCILEGYLFSSKELHISIQFPVKPEVRTKNIQSDLGQIQQTTVFTKRSDSISIEFQIIVTDYPNKMFETVESDSIRQIIIMTIAEELNTFNKGNIIYQQESELNGQPCYWFLIKYDKNQSVKACLLWNGNALVSLIHYAPYDQRMNASSEVFFNSFNFL